VRRPRSLAALAALAVAAALVSAVSLAAFTDQRSNPQTLTAATYWPTPTPTATPTPTPTPTPPPGTGLRARYRNNTPTVPSDNAVTPWMQVINGTSGTIDLTKVKLRYWLTRDTSSSSINVNSFCDYEWLTCTNAPATCPFPAPTAGKVTHCTAPLSPTRPTADTYVEIGFTNGATLARDANTGEIQMRLHRADYGSIDETNDFSYGTNSSYQDWTKVGLYYNGTLVWGTAP
jgi:predicted ribosomally synthesized peptide with SipW-like signal peptide